MGLETIALAALATAAAGTGYSMYSGQKQQKYAKQATQIQRQQAKLSEARQKRDAVRQARMSYATTQAAAESQGVSASSAASGGQGSIISQLADNISFLDQYGGMSDQAQKALGSAQKWESSGRMADAVSGFAMQVYGSAPTISKSASKVFKT